MAGDLLHLIRDAEKKAEVIVQEATVESKAVISRAKESAKRLLQESVVIKKSSEEDSQSAIQGKITGKKNELMTDFQAKESALKEKVVNNKQEAIETVLKLILDS